MMSADSTARSAAQTDGSDVAGVTPDLTLIPGGLRQEPGEEEVNLDELFQEADAAVAAPDESEERNKRDLQQAKSELEQLSSQLKDINLRIQPLQQSFKTRKAEYERCCTGYGSQHRLAMNAYDSLQQVEPAYLKLDKAKKLWEAKIKDKRLLISQLEDALKPKPEVVTDVAAGLKAAMQKRQEELTGDENTAQMVVPPRQKFVFDLRGLKVKSDQQPLVDWVKELVEGSMNGEYPVAFEMPRSRPGAGPSFTKVERNQQTGEEIQTTIPHHACGLPDSVCKHDTAAKPDRFAVMWPVGHKPILVALCKNGTGVLSAIAQLYRDTGRSNLIPRIIKYGQYAMAEKFLKEATQEWQVEQDALKQAGEQTQGGEKTKTQQKLEAKYGGSIEKRENAKAERRKERHDQQPVGRKGDSGSSGGKGGKKGQKGGKKGK